MDQKTTVTAGAAIPSVTIDEAAVRAHVMRQPHIEGVISTRGLEEGIPHPQNNFSLSASYYLYVKGFGVRSTRR
jgi:hypothetical protein